jgi:hypothetical protein
MTTLQQDLADFEERTRQLNAVRAHIEKHGILTKHDAVYVGIEGYGIVPHPGARSHDLRHDEGYEIETRRKPTEWRLVSKPDRSPTLSGFLRYMRNLGITAELVKPSQRTELYKKYCQSIV